MTASTVTAPRRVSALSDPRLAAPLLIVGLAATAWLLYVWWPGGVLLGAVAGMLAVFRIGLDMQAAAVRDGLIVAPATTLAPVAAIDEPAVAAAVADPSAEEGVRGDLEHLKAELGDVWPDFARAARLVVSTQYASAARLQRELQVPYSRARRILDDLESEHFVGPATGSLPRQVLLPKERLPEVERLFATV